MSGDIEESSDPRASSPQSIWQSPSPTRAHNLHSYLLYDMSLDVNETNKEQTQNEVCHRKDLTGAIIIPWVGANEGDVTVASQAPCTVNQATLDTSFRQKCLRLRCHDFSALAD